MLPFLFRVKFMKEKLLRYLETFITERRSNLIDQVLNNRTRYLTVVLEDIYQTHNASAVLRTCDCFGIQDIHIIENRNKYRLNPYVTLGSEKWLDLFRYRKYDDNSAEAIHQLKKKGYRIIATTPHSESRSIDEFDIGMGRAAIFFGTELSGLSDTLIQNADERIFIPMFGFTESFNISVSAAIILYNLITRLRKTTIDWHLTCEEKIEQKIKWIKKGLKMDEKEEFFIDSGEGNHD